MVELESNLGTMVINSDSEDSTMRSIYCSITFFLIILLMKYCFFFFVEHDTNPDKPKYRPQFLDHFDRKKTDASAHLVMNETKSDTSAITPPTAPPIEEGTGPIIINNIHPIQYQQQPFNQPQQQQQYMPHIEMAAHPQYMPQQQHIDIAINSDFVSSKKEKRKE